MQTTGFQDSLDNWMSLKPALRKVEMDYRKEQGRMEQNQEL